MTSRIHRYEVWRRSACPCAVSDRGPAQTLIRKRHKYVGEVGFQMKMGMGALVDIGMGWRTPGSPFVGEKRTEKTPRSVSFDIPADMSHLYLSEQEQVESCAPLLATGIEWGTRLSLVGTQ
jgi:hypothetical protein